MGKQRANSGQTWAVEWREWSARGSRWVQIRGGNGRGCDGGGGGGEGMFLMVGSGTVCGSVPRCGGNAFIMYLDERYPRCMLWVLMSCWV